MGHVVLMTAKLNMAVGIMRLTQPLHAALRDKHADYICIERQRYAMRMSPTHAVPIPHTKHISLTIPRL